MRQRKLVLFFGFTGLLAGILLCGCKSEAKKQAEAKKKSIDNLADIYLALHNHMSANNGDRLPSPGLPKGMKSKDPERTLPYSWRFAVLPFIERVDLYQQVDFGKKGPLPDEVRNAFISTYQNPLSNEKNNRTNYRVFVGNGAAFEWGRSMSDRGDFPDGMANTILVVESAEPIEWASLEDFEYDPNKPLPKLGIFPDGFHALMGNGAVRWIPAGTDEKLIRAMITRNGGEKIELPGTVVRAAMARY